uniref:zinc finger protein ZFAT-like n=2 Tax=Oncorhynchus gorbuscha TaxID=8017 RepID=UPI001EAF25C0
VKPFKCSLCDYASRSKSNLKAHMSRHTTEKKHLCDMCGKKFKSKVTLKSHKLMHTEDGKQFQCTECDYSAAQKPLLVRHMEQHASFKPYRCGHCHYSCNIAGPLKRHYSKKHPNQEYCNAGPGPATSEAVEQQGESLSRDTLISVSHTVPTRSTVTQGLGQPPLRLWNSKVSRSAETH